MSDSQTHYRTETRICVGCGLEVRYRLRVGNPKWKGNFRQAIGARLCPRCTSVSRLAKEGDPVCKKFVDAHAGAYA